jgi:hypothetical protein
MNKKLIIIGILGLAGAGAFLYFKSKNKLGKNDTPSSAGGLVPTSGTSVLSTTTTTTTKPNETSVTIGEVTLTTPVQVVETALKIAEAKGIASQILEMKNKKNRLVNMPLLQYKKESNKEWLQGESYIQQELNFDLKIIDDKIKNLDKTLALLGYTEVNGSIQKI